jgi:hypothetical protein
MNRYQLRRTIVKSMVIASLHPTHSAKGRFLKPAPYDPEIFCVLCVVQVPSHALRTSLCDLPCESDSSSIDDLNGLNVWNNWNGFYLHTASR